MPICGLGEQRYGRWYRIVAYGISQLCSFGLLSVTQHVFGRIARTKLHGLRDGSSTREIGTYREAISQICSGCIVAFPEFYSSLQMTDFHGAALELHDGRQH